MARRGIFRLEPTSFSAWARTTRRRRGPGLLSAGRSRTSIGIASESGWNSARYSAGLHGLGRVLGSEVDVGGPQEGLAGQSLAQPGDRVVQGMRGPGRIRLVGGAGVFGVRVAEAGVDGLGHDGGGGVGDAPQRGQHVPVAGQLQGAGQVPRLVEQPQVACGGLAGRQVGQVGVAQVEVGQVGQGQRLVVQQEGAERCVGWVLDAVAGQVQPAVAGQRVQDGLPGGGGPSSWVARPGGGR